MIRSTSFLFALLLTGCAGTHSIRLRPSALQRYDALGSRLEAASFSSKRLATDSQRLGILIDRDRVEDARAAAIELKLDALALENQTGQTSWRVKSLIRDLSDWRPQRYLRMIVRALSVQWAEAAALTRIADLLWVDPLLLSTRDASLLVQLDGAARWNAWQAVQLVSRASAWKHKYARYFRYVPVRLAPDT